MSFTFSVNTFGKMFGLTRRDIRNDDSSVFEQLPRIMSQGSIKKLERDFWQLVMSGVGAGDFFDSTTGSNYIDGASTVLGIDGLALAVQTMTEQVDSDGDPIFVSPKYLVTSPADQAKADELFASVTVNVGGSNTDTSSRLATANSFRDKYIP